MLLKSNDNHKYKNIHTGELFDSVAVPTGFEKIYQLVEDVDEAEENVTTENNEILERLENVEKQSTKMQSEVSELRNVIKAEIKQFFADYLKLKTE